MSNVYIVKLSNPVQMDHTGHHFTGKETTWLHVVASSFENAIKAVSYKYPTAVVIGIDMLNYTGTPIVIGE